MDRERLIVYGVLGVVMVFMMVFSVGDSTMYRTSLLTAAEKKIVVETALAKLGKPYVLGAMGPNSYDCSSLMIDVFEEIGVELPRRSADQAEVGKAISFEEAEIGDMLFYATNDAQPRTVTHVGMVVKKDGNELWMINANSLNGKVMIDKVIGGKYWMTRQITAKRVNSLTKNMKSIPKDKEESSIKYMPPSEPADPRIEEEEKEEGEEKPTTVSSTVVFNDVEDSNPFKDAIYGLANQNIISGTGENTFDPYRGLTRAELLKISLKAFKTSQIGKSVEFTDIRNHWVEPYVKTAVAKGYVKGYEDNTFKPNRPVNRAEGAKIIGEIGNMTKYFSGNKSFSDLNDSDWAIEYASVIKDKNLLPLNGSSFEPEKTLTRSEAAQLIWRLKNL